MRFNFDNSFKKSFLEIIEIEQGDAYVDRYTDIFIRVSKKENYLEKDMYDFTFFEVSQFLYSFKSTDIYGLYLTSGMIYRYQLMAFNKHKTNIVPKKLQMTDLKNCLDEMKMFSKFLTHNEYLQLIRNLENAQDKVAIVLAWNGVLGVGLKDILNLKVKDVDFVNNVINYVDVDNVRHICKLDGWEIDIIRDAIHQESYTTIKIENVEKKVNLTQEEIEEKLQTKETRIWGDIFVTPYVLRKIGKPRKEVDFTENPFTYAGLRTRVETIKRVALESAISLKSIQDSGIAHRAIKNGLNIKGTDVGSYIISNKLYISAYNLKKLISIISKKINKENAA